MKPKYNPLFGAAAAAITFSSFAYGQTSVTWNGSTSTDWNTASNWDGGAVPTKTPGNQHAVINTFATNTATISGDITPPVDIMVGTGGGSNGRLDHTAGNAATGGGNWMFVGTNGGTGTYNLANTSVAGGGLTGFGQGSGSMSVAGRLYVGGFNAGGANGTVNVNTTGTLAVGSELQVGSGGSTGVLRLENGAITGANWMDIGNGAGSSGTLHMSGGSITKTGSNHFIVGDNGGTGVANVSGGTITVNNEFWVGQGGGSNGTLNLSGSGAITNSSWVAIGRSTGTGLVNMSGGSWTKNGGGNYIIGASGSGTLAQSGGLVDVQTGITWLGEANGSVGTHTLSGSGEFRTSQYNLGVNGGATGNANLNGGTLRTGQILGGNGTANVVFNGTQIIATANQAAFISNLDSANIGNGGLKIDTQSFITGVAQNLAASGTGGLTKTGTGVLSLTGTNTFSGNTAVNAGTLVGGSTDSLPGWNTPGKISVASGAALGGMLGAGGFDETDFSTLLSTATFSAGASIAIDSSIGDVIYTDDLSTKTSLGSAVGLVKTGANSLILDLSGQTFTGGIRTESGKLVLDHGSNITYGGTLSGGGGVTVQGAGTTTLSGTGNQVGQLIANGTGGLNISTPGASITAQGGVIVGDDTEGHVTHSTGVVNVAGGELWIADSPGAVGEYSISGNAVLTVNNWLAIGRRSGQGTLNMSGGTVNKTGGGNVTISTGTGGNGTINQTGGVFNNTGSSTYVGESFTGDGNGTWNLSGTGQANLAAVIIGNGGASNGTINLDGGEMTVTQISENTTGLSIVNFNGGTLKAGAASATFMQGLTAGNVEAGGAVVDSNGFNITINQALVDAGGNGGLSKDGSGTLTLGGANTYTGSTEVNAGTLALGAGGSIANSSTIDLAAGATLDVSALGAWSLASSQTLVGNGTVNGTATIASGSTIAPGNSVGELTFNNNLILAGTADMEVEDGTNDLITVIGAITYGGILDITNIGGPLTGYGWAPTTFDLFDFASQSGSFSSINLPALDAGFTWTPFNYASGSISIVPEPSAFVLAGLGLAGLLVRRRR